MSESQKRLPPQAIDAEKAVLGCILINANSISSALQHLTAESFYQKEHSLIFDTMINLYDKSIPIDSVNLIEELKKNKKLKSVGGAYYITGLTQEAPSASNAEYYAKIVREKEVLRTIISTSISMTDSAYDDSDEVSSILDKAEQSLFSISEQANKKKFEELEPMIHNVLNIWGNRKKGEITGVSSGFQDLDNQISGFQNSDFIVLAARPSMGKTAFAMNLVEHAVLNYDKPVLVFSLEMPSESLILDCFHQLVALIRLNSGLVNYLRTIGQVSIKRLKH